MGFSFQPKTEAEVSNLLPEGVYNFQIKNAVEAISKKGNPMIRITLGIWDEFGKERFITDYLMEALMYKLKHFCDSIGLEEKYKEGQFEAQDCIGKTGKCKLKIEPEGEYPAKNTVKDYLKESKMPVINAAEVQTAKEVHAFFNDDIAF